jgi:hypothetical protein
MCGIFWGRRGGLCKWGGGGSPVVEVVGVVVVVVTHPLGVVCPAAQSGAG